MNQLVSEDNDNNNDLASESAAADAAQSRSAASEYAYQRSARGGPTWQWNLRLLAFTLAIGMVAIALATISYLYHSTAAASTFLTRAEVAAEQGDYSDQSKWLQRYSLLNPDDNEVIYKVAIAADTAADNAAPDRRGQAILSARAQLAGSIARLGTDEADKANELRGRLIKRLIQMGPRWAAEAEREIVAYQAEPGDAQVTDWLAASLFSQVQSGTYRKRRPDGVSKADNHWSWLANQPVGYVLAMAVDANPSSLDAISRFLSLYLDNPELLGQPGSDSGNDVMDQRVARCVQTIRSDPSSRAQLVLYQFLSQDEKAEEALPVLVAAAETAADRLADADPAEIEAEGAAIEPGQAPEALWAYVLVSEAARRLSDDDPEKAAAWYEQLMALELPLPAASTTPVYVSAGILKQVSGDIDAAIAIWEQGLERVSDNSLDLLGRVASARAQKESDDKAPDAVAKFRDAVGAFSDRLRNIPEGQISAAQRSEMGRLVDAANWQILRLEGYLARNEGNTVAAINKLQTALDDPAEVDDRERVLVARQLSALLISQGAWDQAAAVLDRAVSVAPDDVGLRAAAADAYMRAGNRQQAIENWRIAGESASPATQLRSAEALFEQQLRKEPGDRDFSGIRAALAAIRANSTPSADPGAADPDPQAVAAMETTQGRLELLEASLPEASVAAELHLTSPAMADAIAQIASRYPQSEAIQSYAATRLAALDRPEQTLAAIERLQAIGGKDSTAVVITRAQIQAAGGDTKGAAEALIAQADKDPEALVTLLSAAANYAILAGESELAYTAYAKIPDQRHTPDIRFRLTVVAQSLPLDSKLAVIGDKQVTPTELAKYWESRLRELEGDNGTYWRLLEAARLVAQLRADPNPIERDDKRLADAKSVVGEILSRRPNWGQAIAIEGSLLSIEGRGQEAVDELRRAIAAGDGRMQTRIQLWDELTKLGRYDEADREIQAATYASGDSASDFTEARITLAQRKGDYRASVLLAEAAIKEAPDDFRRHVMLCKAWTVAARDPDNAAKRETMIAKASESINKATELAAQDEAEIFEALVGLRLVEGDQKAIRESLAAINNSSLPAYTKYILQARALELIGDPAGAVTLYEQADKFSPSAQTKLRLAELYRNLRRAGDEVTALQEALKLSPENAQIKNALARALVTRDGEKVDWEQIAQLLSTGDRVTPGNRFAYALLLSAGGSDEQKYEALTMLRELFRERNSSSDDAARAMTALLRGQITEAGDAMAADERSRLGTEIESLYEHLIGQPTPRMSDLLGYATYLIDLGDEKDRLKVKSLERRLRSMDSREASVAALDIRIRVAREDGDEASIPQIVATWVDEVVADESFENAAAATVAGTALMRLEFFDEGIDWLRQAYELDSAALERLAGALRQADRHDECIELCAKHFIKNNDVVSAILLVQALTGTPDLETTPEQEELVEQAIKRHGDNGLLLEAVATLRMRQENYPDAIGYYQRALMINPMRLSALNNLAMALSEMPGRAADGLGPIDQAIKIAGEVPELLDTKGVLLMKAKQYVKAKQVFTQAIEGNDEPRYRFHLILTLLAQNQRAEAKAEWAKLDLEKLDPMGLTPAEQTQLEDLKKEFGT